jgi:hypothetical protein
MAGDLELLTAWRAGDQDTGAALFARHFAGVTAARRGRIR